MMKQNKPVVGKGHQSNSNLPVIREPNDRPPILNNLQPNTRYYKMGKVTIFVSPPFNGMGWHMSISHPDRYPTWDEVATAWYQLVPDADNRTGGDDPSKTGAIYFNPQYMFSGA